MAFRDRSLLTRLRAMLRRPTWRGWFSIALVTVVLGIILAWAIDYRTLHGSVARNVTIENIDIGRLDAAGLSSALQSADAAYGTGSVDFVIKGEVTSLPAREIGLELDEKATLVEARRIGREDPTLLKPVYWAASFFVKRHAPVRIRLDESRLALALADLPGQKPAREPVVVGSLGSVGIRAGKNGFGFDPDDVATRIARRARNGELPIRVPLIARPTKPKVSLDAIKLLAVKGYQLTEKPLTLTAPKGSMVASSAMLRSWITSTVPLGTDRVELRIDPEVSRKVASQQLGEIQSTPVDAAFTVEGSQVLLIPDVKGKRCCTDEVGKVILKGLQDDAEEVAMPLSNISADFTTADARKLGITTLLGTGSEAATEVLAPTEPDDSAPRPTNETTTTTSTTLPSASGPGQAVVPLPAASGVEANVRIAMRQLRGRIILPGKSLSLNELLGPPRPEDGYVPAAMATADGPSWISGGGTDLLAAALFRAAYDGGLDIPTSQRHGVVPSGVTPGIEATLGWSEPDLVIKNPSKHAVLVWVDLTRGGVRVQLFSTPFTSSVTTSQRNVPFGPERKCLAVTTRRNRVFLGGEQMTDVFEARYTPPPSARDDPDRVICPN